MDEMTKLPSPEATFMRPCLMWRLGRGVSKLVEGGVRCSRDLAREYG